MCGRLDGGRCGFGKEVVGGRCKPTYDAGGEVRLSAWRAEAGYLGVASYDVGQFCLRGDVLDSGEAVWGSGRDEVYDSFGAADAVGFDDGGGCGEAVGLVRGESFGDRAFR